MLNRDKRIVAAFGGELLAMHARPRERARRTAMRPVPAPFDVVVTTNSGYPLDQNLYQAVKGMSAAAQVVKPGGTIVVRRRVPRRLPRPRLLPRASSRRRPRRGAARRASRRAPQTVPDQWQIQVQAKIQAQARVRVHTSYLSDAELAAAHLEQVGDVAAAVHDALAEAGPGAPAVRAARGPADDPVRGSSGAGGLSRSPSAKRLSLRRPGRLVFGPCRA